MSPPTRFYSASAALILAKSLTEVFPLLQPLRSGATPHGFFCEFLYSQPLTEQLFPLIEEHLRGILKAQLEIQATEMLRTNAIELFRHHKRDLQVDWLMEQEDYLVSLGRIGDFWELVEGPFLESTSDIKAIKLLSLQAIPQGMRIEGVAFGSKEELKTYLKQWAEAQRHSPLVSTVKQKVWCGEDLSDHVIWLPYGLAIRNVLLNPWKQFCERWLIPITQSFSSLTELDTSLPNWAEVACRCSNAPQKFLIPLLSPLWSFFDHIHLQSTPHSCQQLIECLQLQKQLAALFELPVQWVASKHSFWKKIAQEVDVLMTHDPQVRDGIQMQLSDQLGYFWDAGLLQRTPAGTFSISLLGSLERLITLLFERWKGALPLWIVPEQLRVFAVGAETVAWAKEVVNDLNRHGLRVALDQTTGDLRQRLLAVECYQPAHVAVIGPREADKQLVTLRLSKGREEHLPPSILKERLISLGGARANDLFGCMKSSNSL